MILAVDLLVGPPKCLPEVAHLRAVLPRTVEAIRMALKSFVQVMDGDAERTTS